MDWTRLNYKINTILCNPNTNFILNVDQNDTIHNAFFKGVLSTINGADSKFNKVLFTGNGNINGNNTFDTLSFDPGRNYHLQSNSTQTINDHLSALGNGCFPITIHSSQTGLQSTISKASGNVVCGYIEMRDQNATGGATFYAGQYSSNVSNNTGWIFADGPGYIYGLGADTSFCQGDTLLITTEYFYGGISWLWQDGSTNSYYKATQSGTYWVKVTYSNDCFYSDTIHVTRKPKPVAVATSNSPVCSGDTLKFFGNGGVTYLWTGPAGFSSNLQNPEIIISTPSNSGNYILTATQNGCTSAPDTIIVQVATVLSTSISIIASVNPVYAGNSVTFTATPTNGGSAPLYQWIVNGINVGTNIPTYTYVPVNGDLVKCILTSNLSCVINNPATSNQITMITLSGNPCPGIPTVTYSGQTYNTVQIGTQCWFKENLNIGTKIDLPSYQTNNEIIEKYCFNNDINNCNVYGGLYQWDEMMQYSETEGGQGICPAGWHIPSKIEWELAITFLGGNAVAGEKMKEEGTLHWSPPNIATNSSEFSALGGGYLAYHCCYSNFNELAYFWTSTHGTAYWEWWFLYMSNSGTNIVSNYGYDQHEFGFSVRCLKDPCTSYFAVSVSISASANPICAGLPVTITATPTNGGSSPTYQWIVNGANVGNNDSFYTCTPTNNDVVTCVLTSNANCVTGNPATSNTITMTVNATLPVSVLISASANPVCTGTSVTYMATPTNGGSTPAYQWKVNGSTVGTNSAAYTYTPANGDMITCVLTSNSLCATGNPATSNTITMSVNATLPVNVLISASNNPVCTGTSVTYTATPTNGGSTPAYQWKVNGSTVGTNSAAYTYIPTNNDVVICVLTSNANCVTGNPATSNTITMTVGATLPVSVLISASDNPVCTGTSVTYTATPTNGGSTPAYQWKVNGSTVGTNSAAYIYTPANGDMITCVLTSNSLCATGNPATSNTITMSVNATLPVSVLISASANPVCAGTLVTYIATPTNGGSNPTYQWKVNGNRVGINRPIYSYIPANNDIITCILTSNSTCATGNPATSNAITMAVNAILPVSVLVSASANPVCAGTLVTFTATQSNGGFIPSYHWKVNGINVGINSPTYSYIPINNDSVSCAVTFDLLCISNNIAISNTVIMNTVLSPHVSFTTCIDTITTINAQPYILKGCIPLGGIYSGPGVNSDSGKFYPSTAGIGSKTITYFYSNIFSCSSKLTFVIHVLELSTFSCGSSLIDIRDNQIYPTFILPSGKCWMATNLNYGTAIPGNQIQVDNCINEKYCLQDNFENCTLYGGLYQWDELMQYKNIAGIQGLCPPGWHIPESTEWEELLNFYDGTSLAGTDLKDSTTLIGFHAILRGLFYLNNTWSVYTGPNRGSMYWTSTVSSTIHAIARGLNYITQSVSLYNSSRANAFNVRCIKD
ncbi:MAG: hypothetical protein NTX43_01240 [Bacteroidetes bacterium]|nr:hypothetical protein [Bacteroidota bacterium]